MNEQIRELVRQARLDDADFPIEDWDNVPLARFAQLIVWEAINVCKVDVDALTAPFLSEYEKGIVEGYRRANENLRFHFGVEE